MTVKEFFSKFPTDEACLNHIFDIRFGQGFECPKCERSAKWYRIKAERAYSCQHCGHHIHPTVGTPFEASRTSLQSWFYAIYLFTTSRHGVPAKELQRQLGVTYKTAWRMGHKIREHMDFVDGDAPLVGDVEIDEAYMGGAQPHSNRRKKGTNKTIVLGMLERDGDVHTEVIPNIKSDTLKGAIKDTVITGSKIHTDELQGYKGINKHGYLHGTVRHSQGQYVSGDTHVNTLEGFWSIMKKGIAGTHVHASKKHMSKYAKEFEYRYNSRHQPEGMFDELTTSFESVSSSEEE